MPIFGFGAGVAFQRVDRGGGLTVARKFATLQGVDVKMAAPIKMMHGGNVYPEDAASGNRKIDLNIKWGKIRGSAVADILGGSTPAPGRIVPVVDEVHAASGGVTVDHATGGIVDLGVESGTTGNALERTLGTVAPGKYTVDEPTGAYAFDASETGDVRISYRYFDATSGSTVEFNNPVLGSINAFEFLLTNSRFAKNMGMLLYRVVASDYSFPTKQEDYIIQDLKAEAFVDEAKASPGQLFFSTDD